MAKDPEQYRLWQHEVKRVAGAKNGSVAYGAGRLNCEKALR